MQIYLYSFFYKNLLLNRYLFELLKISVDLAKKNMYD
jgi:hypothetical protein